jgi:hypothetical protein
VTLLATGLAVALNRSLVPRIVERASRALPLEAIAGQLPETNEETAPSSDERSLEPLVLKPTSPRHEPPREPSTPSHAADADATSTPPKSPKKTRANETESTDSTPSHDTTPPSEPERGGSPTSPPSNESHDAPDRPEPTEPSKSTARDRPSSSSRDAPDNGDATPETSPPVQTFHLDRHEIRKRLEHPEAIRRKIDVRSVPESSSREGVVVHGLKGDYGRLGLQPGDRVVAINGRDVENRRHALARLMNMKDRRVFRLEVRRAGEPRIVEYVVE